MGACGMIRPERLNTEDETRDEVEGGSGQNSTWAWDMGHGTWGMLRPAGRGAGERVERERVEGMGHGAWGMAEWRMACGGRAASKMCTMYDVEGEELFSAPHCSPATPYSAMCNVLLLLRISALPRSEAPRLRGCLATKLGTAPLPRSTDRWAPGIPHWHCALPFPRTNAEEPRL